MQQPAIAPHAEQNIIRWESVLCDLCGSSDAEFLLDGIDWEFGLREQFRIVRCRQCSLVYLNPRPQAESIPLIYPPSYANFRQSHGLRRLLKILYYKITAPYPYLDGITPGRILDVGCATGHTNYPYGENGSLRQLKKKGWDVCGLELNQTAANIARSNGIHIYDGRLSDIPSFGDRFDVIRFNHVLEHSMSPTDDLAIAARLLKDHGRLIISGPNIESAAFWLFQKYWSGLDLPRHFYQFSPATLRQFCEKSHLRVDGEYHDGRVFDFIHSTRHFLQSTEITGKHAVCQGVGDARDNAIKRLFSPASLACLHVATGVMVRFFNRSGISDSYTIIAMPQ